MNKDKIIKDLKEKNHKLKTQYELQEVRLYSSQRIVDNLKEEILEYKGIKGQLLATIDEKNKIIDQALKLCNRYIANEKNNSDPDYYYLSMFEEIKKELSKGSEE
jgi:hypothetical protein